MEIKEKIREKIFDVIEKEWPNLDLKKEELEINYPDSNFGDYSSNVALKMVPVVRKNPIEIAEKIAEIVGKDNLFEKVSAAKPGFVNMAISKEIVFGELGEVLGKEGEYAQKAAANKKLHLDFVSANPTGPIHLGNGRGGPFGDVLGKIFEKRGWEVWREYYVNDFGNQIKVLGHSVLKDDEAQYKGEYIDKLHQEIEAKDPFEAGQEACRKIIEEIIRPSMEKLGIGFDEYFSEKALHENGKVEKVFEELKEKGYVYEEDGALWFKATEFDDEKDRVIRKSSGEITYFGGDISYHKSKFERGADKAIDVWGADHHGDVKRVMGAMEALGFGGRLEIILTQMVRVIKDGQELKMSKRKGTYVSVDDLIEEVGKDAVRFFFLMYSSDTHMNFDIDLAKEQSNKNPVYYVQYAHARICSILEKAKKEGVEFDGNGDGWKALSHEKEMELGKMLLRLPELVSDIEKNYEVHRLPYYAMELADKFHSFYHECRVIDEENADLSKARLGLVTATKNILKETLGILGVDAPEQM